MRKHEGKEMFKLQHCTPEFIRKCCPDQSGNVIFFNGTFLLLTEISVLSTSAVEVILSTEDECKEWYENGQLHRHCHYVNGTLEGEYKSWHKNGQLGQYCHYVNNRLEGEYKFWHDDGQLGQHCHYKNGKFVKSLL